MALVTPLAVAYPAPRVAAAAGNSAELADLSFELTQYAGTGCPSDRPKSVEVFDGGDDDTALQLFYNDFDFSVSGLNQDGKQKVERLDCRVRVRVTYNKDYKLSFRRVYWRGNQHFRGGGAKGHVWSVLENSRDGDRVYTANHPLKGESTEFETGASNLDPSFKGCGETVEISMDIKIRLNSGSGGEYARARLGSGEVTVNDNTSELAVELRQC